MKSTHILCARFSALLLVLLFSSTIYAGSPKVEVCHVPPGNPDNFHTIKIKENALGAHLGHGDLAGACDAVCAQLCDDGDACTVDDVGDCETNGCPVVSEPVDCSDGNLCTDDLCDSVAGCSNLVAVTCEPANLCVTSACDPIFGVCEETAKMCDDGETCNPDNGMCEENEPDPGTPNICPCFGGTTTEEKIETLTGIGTLDPGQCGALSGFPDLAGAFYNSGTTIACSGLDCSTAGNPSCGIGGSSSMDEAFPVTPEQDIACQALFTDFCPFQSPGATSNTNSAVEYQKPLLSNAN